MFPGPHRRHSRRNSGRDVDQKARRARRGPGDMRATRSHGDASSQAAARVRKAEAQTARGRAFGRWTARTFARVAARGRHDHREPADSSSDGKSIHRNSISSLHCVAAGCCSDRAAAATVRAPAGDRTRSGAACGVGGADSGLIADLVYGGIGCRRAARRASGQPAGPRVADACGLRRILARPGDDLPASRRRAAVAAGRGATLAPRYRHTSGDSWNRAGALVSRSQLASRQVDGSNDLSREGKPIAGRAFAGIPYFA